MATIVTKQIKADGTGHYTSLAAFEAAEQRDLVLADEVAQAECYGFTEDVASATLTFAGWTTDATRYVHVVAAAGAEATIPLAAGYRLFSNGPSLLSLDAATKVVFERIQLDAASGAAAQRVIDISAGVVIEFIGCSLRGTGAESGIYSQSGTNITARIRNCFVHNFDLGIRLHMGAGTNTLVVYNNTVVDCTTNGILTRGTASTSAYLKNNIVQGGGTNYTKFSSYAVYQSANNISEDATSPDGAAWQNKVVTFADELGDDFHLASGDAVAKDAGVDLSADPIWPFSADFDGQARTIWDVGADEFVAAGGGTTPVSRSADSSWQTRASIERQAPAEWSVRSAVARAAELAYHVRSTISRDAALSYHLRAIVSSDAAAAWDVASSLTSVSRTADFTWHIGASIARQADLGWHVRMIVGRDAELRAHVRQIIGRDASLAWADLITTSRDAATAWHLQRMVSANADLAWNTLSEIIVVARPENQVHSAGNVRAVVSAPNVRTARVR